MRRLSSGFSQKEASASSKTNLTQEDIKRIQERQSNPERQGKSKSQQTDGAKPRDANQLAGDAKKKKPKGTLLYAEALPLSIQPNADYFVDVPSSPFGQLAQLIEVSDGGVFAVTGVRGAGKSVLLNKISKHFQNRFHTLCLAAPTGSSHEMDFFMALFRVLCDSVSKRLRKTVLREHFDLRAIGKRQVRRQAWMFLSTCAAFIVFALLGIYFQLKYNDAVETTSQFWYGLDALKSRLADAETEFSSKNAKSGASDAQAVQEEKTEVESLKTRIKDLESASKKLPIDKYFYNPADLAEVESAIYKLGIKFRLSRWYYSFWYDLDGSVVLFGVVVASIGILLARLVFLFVTRFARLRKTPEAVGLLESSKKLMDYLDYELSQSRGSEISLPLPLIKDMSGKIKRSTDLKQRSLSLPGLTTQYISYVEQLIQVFPNKIIICVDELDKITELDNVRSILREIKGGLYVKGCFYIISLSEDAFHAFGGRLSSTRDIFESTFDEILNIDRLSLDSCRQVLKHRFVENPRTPNPFGAATEQIILLCSILSSGIPRDLVRHSRECVLTVQGMPNPTVRLCWDRLFRRKLNEVKNEVLIFLGCDEIRAELIEEVDVLLFVHGAPGADLSETLLRLEETVGELDTKLKIHLDESDEKLTAEADCEVAIKGWIRNWVELEIYVLCAMLMTKSLKEEDAEELRYIYSLLMYSTERSRAKLRNFFLDKSGMVPGSTQSLHDGSEGPIIVP